MTAAEIARTAGTLQAVGLADDVFGPKRAVAKALTAHNRALAEDAAQRYLEAVQRASREALQKTLVANQ